MLQFCTQHPTVFHDERRDPFGEIPQIIAGVVARPQSQNMRASISTRGVSKELVEIRVVEQRDLVSMLR